MCLPLTSLVSRSVFIPTLHIIHYSKASVSSTSSGSVLWPLLSSTLSGTVTQGLECEHAEGTHWSLLHSNKQWTLCWIFMTHHAPGKESEAGQGEKKNPVMEDCECCGCSTPLPHQPPSLCFILKAPQGKKKKKRSIISICWSKGGHSCPMQENAHLWGQSKDENVLYMRGAHVKGTT